MALDMNNGKYTVAEIFCGCGGFSHGFSRSGRFEIVFGNDVKKAALNTFRQNHKNGRGQMPETIEGDIRAVSLDTIADLLARRGIGDGELTCLIGGPPCQGFSQMRRGEERKDNAIVKFGGYNRLDQDPRNDLVLRFLEVANALRPKFILIENVPQMRTHAHDGKRGGLIENVEILLKEMGYDPKHEVVNAADYGVPQLRERLIIFASRVCDASFPEKTNAESSELPTASSLPAWVTVEQAIRDLPPPAAGPEDVLGGALVTTYPPVKLSGYSKKMRSKTAFPHNHVTRSYGSDIIETIKEMRQGETWDTASERKRREYQPLIANLTSGEDGLKAAIEVLARQGLVNSKFFKKYYWSAYTRLAWDKPALTITANANFLGSGRFTHPEENRGITMREAARLQSFDDDFKFITRGEGDVETKNIGVGLDMIGEAVPPLLAEAFAKHVAALLDRLDKREKVVERALPIAKSAPPEFAQI